MRVVAGKYKRTLLNTLEGDATRPTKDMVREALFDSIYICEGDSFLDLFSGSGAIGIEALSRGADYVVFNDINKEAIEVIESNLKKINENKLVLNFDYKECLNHLRNKQFSYIYIDPPYSFKEYETVLELISQNNVLKNEGIILVELRKDVNLNDEYNSIIKFKEKKYGITKLLYYRKKD